ncbi:major capsid protein [Sphingopyxis macrogoltabida]|uniref:Coat protein n=1 Tax=Sphingopyxis macrogoltabida TaxID=33050 RepID=A0AAC9AVS8_SPHMC|nr:major capsid protein [Sphingopyxis macrogoltabida]ALJ12632.1 coat protein [Sphingopyxis macrogoltabida]AMU89899.1 coat protein [Sphingopyxis macrogoltabida]
MRYFSQNLMANSRPHQAWWAEVSAQREAFRMGEDAMAPLMANMARNYGLVTNAAAVLPRDAWLEMDTITRRVMRDDEGQTYMADLMALARPIHIGKIAFKYRVASDSGTVRRSLSGKVPEVLGKTDYDYRGTLVPIFNTGYGRSWREWNSLQSENFDALSDDQESHTAAIREDMADYALDGDTTLTFEGEVGYGIRNHPYAKSINLGSAVGGANIDLADPNTTADDIDEFFTQTFGAMLDANLVTEAVNLYISPEIARNWDRQYSGSAGFKGGRIFDFMLTNRRIKSIKVTHKLSGNQFFGFVPSSNYIRPLIGMAASTTAAVRLNPVDDYNFLVMAAMGIDIRSDWNGKSGVFYSVVVN